MTPLLLVLSIAGPGVGAADDAVSPAIVTSRLHVGVEVARSQATVLDGPALTARDSLADALQTMADVQVQQPGGRGGMASVFLRGADPNFTVVMLEGVPLNDTTNSRGGSVNVSEIPTLGLERVEVARGPWSSLYGSGALAGAINLVISGGAPRPGGALFLGGGLEGQYTAMAQWRGPLSLGYGASLTAVHDDAGNPTPGGRFRSSSLTGKLAMLNGGDGAQLFFRLADTHAESFPDNSGGQRLAKSRKTDRRDGDERILAGRLPPARLGDTRFEVSASTLIRKDRQITPGVEPSAFDAVGSPAGDNRTRFRRDNIQAIARYAPTVGRQALVGLGYQREEGRDVGALNLFGAILPTHFNMTRDTVSAFAEAGLLRGRWGLNVGGRVDRPEGLGRHATGRASLEYALPVEGLTFHAAAGSAFKAPSFYALGNPFVGNRDLKPETSRSGELGLAWRVEGKARLSITAFSARYTNLIDFVPRPYPHLANVSRVTSKGAAARLDLVLSPSLSAAVDATYADTQDAETKARLLNRAKWRTVFTMDWTARSDLDLRARYSYVGGREDYAIPTGAAVLKPYGALSLEADWRPVESVTLGLTLDDALDSRGEDAIGFPAPGRQLRLVVRRDF